MRRSPVRISFAFVLGLSLTLVLLWLLSSGLPTAHAIDLKVCVEGLPTCPYASIQAAVDAAVTGDVIKVAAGTYTTVTMRPRNDITTTGDVTQVVYLTKTVTIRGGYTTTNSFADPPDPVANPTILDAKGQGRVIYVTGNITPTIEGLHLTGGNAAGLQGTSFVGSWDSGGGMYIITASATLSRCQVYNNVAGVTNTIGGGIYLNASSARLYNNRLFSNTAEYGGGMFADYGSPTLGGNTFATNTASIDGGGAHLYYSVAALDGNTVFSNDAQYGGGLYFQNSSDTLSNTIVANNRASLNGSGLYMWGASPRLLHTTLVRNTGGDGSSVYVTQGYGVPSTVALTNTILVSQTVGITVTAGNTATLNGVLWSGNDPNFGGPGLITVTNDITGSPAFVNPDAGNYHLTAASAAIDRGVDAGVATDLDGIARPQGSQPDLGAYELPWYTLTMNTTGNGAGSVTPTVGTHSYVSGATVWLTATANTGSTFAGWSGAVSGTTNPISVTMDANKAVTATINLNTYTLTVATAGLGSGVVTPTVGTHPYDYGTLVTLGATANTGSTFSGWSGDADCTDGSVTMNADKSCTATFTPGTNDLPVANAGPDQTVGVSTTVTLNGSASYDPDNRLPLSYAWTQTGGPSVTYNDVLSVTAFTAPGTSTVLTFTLTVTDAWGLASTPDTVVIAVRHMVYLPVVIRAP